MCLLTEEGDCVSAGLRQLVSVGEVRSRQKAGLASYFRKLPHPCSLWLLYLCLGVTCPGPWMMSFNSISMPTPY